MFSSQKFSLLDDHKFVNKNKNEIKNESINFFLEKCFGAFFLVASKCLKSDHIRFSYNFLHHFQKYAEPNHILIQLRMIFFFLFHLYYNKTKTLRLKVVKSFELLVPTFGKNFSLALYLSTRRRFITLIIFNIIFINITSHTRTVKNKCSYLLWCDKSRNFYTL